MFYASIHRNHCELRSSREQRRDQENERNGESHVHSAQRLSSPAGEGRRGQADVRCTEGLARAMVTCATGGGTRRTRQVEG
jgi:hypothetical protein